MIKLRWKNKWLQFVSVEWSGTDTQCSRQLQFTIPSDPYNSNFKNQAVALGDLVYLYDGTAQLFVGTVTTREKTAEVGTAVYTAMDFMHHLLKSSASYTFRNTTPEKITKKVCADFKIKTAKLAATKVNIPKLFFDDQCIYDIIVAAYRRAKAKNGKKYMPAMAGQKVTVIQKGRPSKVKLQQGFNVTGASYTDTLDNMVDSVNIYNEKRKKLGNVQNRKAVEKYGIYQKAYTKEKGANAKKEAKALLEGITKEASIEAVGDVRAVSGYSIEIDDKAAGLSGTFYIVSDTHTFSDGIHTMSLELAWKNVMEEGAESEADSGKKELENRAACYYLDGSSVYHSSTSCSSCKGKAAKKSTVAKMKKIKIAKGKNKGRRKYKACSRCWIT